MSSLIMPTVRTRKPDHHVQLDWSNHLLQKIQPVGVYIFVGGVPVNLVTGIPAVAYGTPAAVIDPQGGLASYSPYAASGSTTASYWDTKIKPDASFRFLARWGRSFALSNSNDCGSQDGTNKFLLAPSGYDSNGRIALYQWGNSANSTSRPQLVASQREMLAMSVSYVNSTQGAISGFLNGKLLSTSATTTFSAQSTRNIYLGKCPDPTATEDGSVSASNANNTDLVIFGRGSLTSLEVAELHANPYQILKPIQRKIWVPVSSGGSSVSGTPIVFEWAQTSSTFKESVNANPNAWAWETTPASMITKLQCSPVASEWAVTTGSIQDSAATSVTGNPVSFEWAQTSATFRTTLQASPIALHWETTQSEISESINATPAAWEWNTTTGSLLGTTSVDANPIAWAWEQTQATILQKSAEEETHETIGGKPDKKVKLPFYDSQKPYISHVEIEQPVFTEKTVNQPSDYFDVALPAVKYQQEQAMLSDAMTPLGALAASEIAVQLPDEKIIYLDSAIEESVIVSLLLAA